MKIIKKRIDETITHNGRITNASKLAMISKDDIYVIYTKSLGGMIFYQHSNCIVSKQTSAGTS